MLFSSFFFLKYIVYFIVLSLILEENLVNPRRRPNPHVRRLQHIVSSPHFPRSNGLAEVSVKIIKNILRKSEESGSDPHIGLLQYRNTPRGNLSSLAKLIMSRNLRSKLPNQIKNLRPKIVDC
ncbi:hypothetical protein PYW07_012934 [Mythimna separata]|uniref:Integrase catalytic domain-containing protein n=1 Tax=Mythimna separata TaxID=271217 RepID=A0AAD7Y9B8_MYTSE|nr:hypothetical protein PYW07_012934 [Mythimna separata]